MNEKDMIIHQIFKISASIAKRRRSANTAERQGSTAYARTVRQSIALDEQRITNLHLQLENWK